MNIFQIRTLRIILLILISHSISFAQDKSTDKSKIIMEEKRILEYVTALEKLGKIKNPKRVYEILTKANTDGIILWREEVASEDVKYLFYEADVIYFRYGSNTEGFFYVLTTDAWKNISKVIDKQ
jgi:ATP-dependent RNA circularization protein (DNA/RNA ligase family)